LVAEEIRAAYKADAGSKSSRIIKISVEEIRIKTGINKQLISRLIRKWAGRLKKLKLRLRKSLR